MAGGGEEEEEGGGVRGREGERDYIIYSSTGLLHSFSDWIFSLQTVHFADV